MAEVILEARVKQKTGTEADFAGFTLLEGEIALVKETADGPVLNFKVGPGLFDDLPYSLDFADLIVKGIAEPSTDPAPEVTGDSYFAGAGTFTNFLDSGGVAITTTENLNVLTYNGTFWDVLPIPISVDLSGYATLEEVSGVNDSITEVQSDINLFSHPSKNLINRMVLEGGYYATTGVKSDSDNWVRTPHIPILAGSNYTLSGQGPMTGNARICHFDSNHDFISFVAPVPGTDPVTFTTPPGSSYIGITVANEVGAGLDPANSTFATTVQLEAGDSATQYQEYGMVLESTTLDNIDFINGTRDKIDSVTIASKNLIDKSQIQAATYSAANGTTSASDNWLCTPLIPVAANTSYTLSGQDGFSATQARFCFFGVSQNFLESILSLGPDETGPLTVVSPASAAFIGINIANEIGIGLNPTDNPFSNGVQFELGTQATEYQPYGTLLNADKLSEAPETLAEQYFEFDIDGGDGFGEFVIYSRVSNTNHYVGFEVRHEVDTSEEVYKDLWRICAASVYRYVGGSFSPTGREAMVAGESECVYRTPGRADFTGGIHGNEKIISNKIWFYADGVKIDFSNNIPLTSCDVFQYRQQSNMYEAPASGGVVNPSHPIEAMHDKITTFEGGGYETFNRLTWQASLTISIYYHGICCIGKDISNVVMNEYLEEQTMTGSDQHYLNKVGGRKYFGTNETHQLSASANSKLLLPTELDSQCETFVWDRVADSKYYRQLPPSQLVVNGDVYESEMTVKFGKA